MVGFVTFGAQIPKMVVIPKCGVAALSLNLDFKPRFRTELVNIKYEIDVNEVNEGC